MKLYRGYNKNYQNWGVRPEQNYIWTTNDIDYALEYAKLFDNGGLVEFDVNENQLNIADDYDGEELFGDDWYYFGGLIDADNDMIQTFIDNGYNSALLDNSGIDCYLLFDKNLIKSAKELSIDYDENIINEVLRIAGVQQLNEEIVFMKKDGNFQVFKMPTRQELRKAGLVYCRVVEDDNGIYYFGSADEYIHSNIVSIAQDFDNAEFNYVGEYNFGFDVILYDVKNNIFYYRCDYVGKNEYNEYLEYARDIFNNGYFHQSFGNFKVEITNEELPWEK